MPQLTEHFSEAELGVEGQEQRLKDSARFLCETLLEPVRAHYGKALLVHDGYRNPEHNSSVGGKPKSWHLFSGTHAAVDFHVDHLPLTELFRWIRMESRLPFDKVILEHTFDGIPRCIHFQVDRALHPRRQALVGSVADGKDYQQVEVA